MYSIFRKRILNNLLRLLPLVFLGSLFHWNSTRVDYSNLETYLTQARWMEADEETAMIIHKLLLKKVDRESFFGASRLDLLGNYKFHAIQSKFECDFLEIDRLWRKYSDGNYGFSRQATMIKTSTAITSSRQVVNSDTINLFVKNFHWDSRKEYRDREWYESAKNTTLSRGSLPSNLWVMSIGIVPKPITLEDTLILTQKFSSCHAYPAKT